MEFDTKVVVVAGATSGVGHAAAGKFARAGAILVLLGRRTDLGETLRDDLMRSGTRAEFYGCDWTDSRRLTEIAETVHRAHGRLDVLYNHAGTLIVKPFLATADTEWEWLFAANLHGMVRSTRAFLPLMLEGGGGAIVNMASISGLTASPLESAYCATKGACVQLTRAIAVEFRERGVRCNAVCPAFIETAHGRRELDDLVKQGGIAGLSDITALQGRMATEDEVAEAVLFLASPRASFVNGAALVIDNGALAAT